MHWKRNGCQKYLPFPTNPSLYLPHITLIIVKLLFWIGTGTNAASEHTERGRHVDETCVGKETVAKNTEIWDENETTAV